MNAYDIKLHLSHENVECSLSDFLVQNAESMDCDEIIAVCGLKVGDIYTMCGGVGCECDITRVK